MEATRLGNRIRAFRKLKGYTQQQFAEQLGVSVAVLGSIERGMKDPTDRMLGQIAALLKIDSKDLYGE